MNRLIFTLSAVLLLSGCAQPVCKTGEILTDLHFGAAKYMCVSKEVQMSIVYSKCIEKTSILNKSMSSTWGNNEYNTAPVSELTERILDRCIKDLTPPTK